MSWWLVLNQTLFISNSGNVTAVRSNNPIFEGFLQISHGYLSDEFSFCQPMKCTRRLKFSGRSKTEYSWHGICMSYKLVCVLRGQGTRPRKTRKKDKNYFFKRIGYSVTSLFIFWVFNIEYWFISYNRILKIRRKFLDLLKLGYNEPRSKYLRARWQSCMSFPILHHTSLTYTYSWKIMCAVQTLISVQREWLKWNNVVEWQVISCATR